MPDELALLRSLAPERIVPTLVLDGELGLDAARDVLAQPTPCWVLVRSPHPGSFFALVATEPLAEAAMAVAARSCAYACFGVSPSRFSSSVRPDEPADDALGRHATALRHALPPPAWERVAFVVRCARSRDANAPLVLQSLLIDAGFVSASSRDARTGEGPIRAGIHASPEHFAEVRSLDRPLEELEQTELRAILRDTVPNLESAALRPVRVSFVTKPELQVVSIQPARRGGVAAFALASDLVAQGVISHERALALIDPADLAIAAPLTIDATDAFMVRGVAAGPGTAEGFACLSYAEARAWAAAGLAPILFTHEVVPEEMEALRGCAAVVTVRGGLTGEAAIIARGLSKPCVASGASLSLSPTEVRSLEDKTAPPLRTGDRVSIDGGNGLVVWGAHPRALRDLPAKVEAVLNALPQEGIAAVDHPAHVVTARRLGARGIGLARPQALLVAGPLDLSSAVLALYQAANSERYETLSVRGLESTLLPGGVPDSAHIESFRRACEDASRATGVGTVWSDEAATSPDAILVARLGAARTRDSLDR